MVCQRIQLPDGGTAIVCGPRGRNSPPPCDGIGAPAHDSPDGWRCKCSRLADVYQAEAGGFIVLRHKQGRRR